MPMPFQQRVHLYQPRRHRGSGPWVGQSVPCRLRDAGRLHRHQGPGDRLLPVRALVGRWRRAAPDGRERQRRGPRERSGAEARSSRAPRRRQAGARARAVAGPQRRWEERRDQKLELLREVSPLSRAAAGPLPAATVGAYVGLCLLIEFPDVPATIPQTRSTTSATCVGYSGFGNNGSVRDYFFEVSRRQADLHEHRHGVLHRRPQPRVLHRPDDPVRRRARAN